MRNLHIIKYRKIWYSISIVLFVLSIASLSTVGLKYGLDFTGGSLVEVQYAKSRPSNSDIATVFDELAVSLNKATLKSSRIQPSGDLGAIIRMPEVTEAEHQTIVKMLESSAKKISNDNAVIEKRFESFGSSLGQELKTNAIIAIVIVLLAIISYLSYAFRKVSHPVASWKFGTVAVVALAHDTVILLGFFSLLGYLYGTEIDSLFVTAMLTLLGFSVHDTIVTLDRVRENLFKHQDQTFEELVDRSINETVTRSINTSMTTLFALIAVFLFGGASIRDFSLALIFGIIIGTYSSIFNAAPLLVSWYNFSRKNRT